MSLFEWLWERKSPRPVGHIERKYPDSETPQNGLFVGIAALILLGVGGYFLLKDNLLAQEWQWVFGKSAGLAVYIWLGSLFKFNPRYDNMGWLGGAIDNPFRFSDDLNRLLFLLKSILLPGRFVAYGIGVLVVILRSRASR